MTDTELLRQYVNEGSQDAFTQLVRQHVDVVYSAARRQARGDSHLAEEITQQVFILLAQKAKTLSDDVLLGGWLYNAARFIARDQLRKVENRARHEQKAAAMAEQARSAAATGGKQDAWTDAEEMLDDVLEKLDAPTRGLIVLRYFEGKTAGEVAARLNISEDAARKRVNRAVEQLRDLFARRGVVMSATALAESLAAKTVIHAPAHLAASAASAAMSSCITASSGAAASSAGAIKTGAVVMAAKGNLIAASILGAVFLTGAVVGGVKAVHYFSVAQPTSPGATKTIRVAPAMPALAGIVRDPAGQPLAGAEMLLASQGNGINIYQPVNRNTPVVKSNTDGTFSMDKPATHFELIVRSPKGFAQISSETLAKSTNIQIAPWARIEGQVLAGTTPMPNAAVWAFEVPAPYGFTTMMRQKTVRTDSTGHFVFTDIAPGEFRLALEDPVMHRQCRWVYGVADAGKTKTINIGGTGRPVVGKFVADASAAAAKLNLIWDYKNKVFYPNTDLRRTNPLPVAPPEHQSGETLEEYRAIEEAFGRTPEGQIVKEAAIGSIGFRVNPDGTFRIDDVPAGDYTLNASIVRANPDMNYTEDFAKTKTEFTVDPMPGDRSDQALDLGNLTMKPAHYLQPGDEATPFQFTTADDVKHSITDYRGKHLLIILCSSPDWARAMIEPFKSIADQYKNDPRLQVIWLMLTTSEEAKKAAHDFEISGTIASCIEFDAPGEYAATIGGAILIDPAGKLVQKHMLDAKIAARVIRQAVPPVK